MKDLKKQLIRLGYEAPELRDHLTPVLACLDKTAMRFQEDSKLSKGYKAFSIGGPMNRDHRIGDPIPSDAEWVIYDSMAGKEHRVIARDYRTLRGLVEKAADLKIPDEKWKHIESLLDNGNKAKVSLEPTYRVSVYN